MADYTSKAKITKITATSRASVKIRDSYFTLEYSEERVIPDQYDGGGVDIEAERALLWQTVNDQVDIQVNETIAAVKRS